MGGSSLVSCLVCCSKDCLEEKTYDWWRHYTSGGKDADSASVSYEMMVKGGDLFNLSCALD